MAELIPAALRSRADAIRCTSTGAFATLGLFLLCWIFVALDMPLSASHGFVALFTVKPMASVEALWTGGLWAFVTGGVAGALVAHCYNLAGRLLGR